MSMGGSREETTVEEVLNRLYSGRRNEGVKGFRLFQQDW